MKRNNEITIDAHDLSQLKSGKRILRTLLQPFELFDCINVNTPTGEIVKLEIISSFIRIVEMRLAK